MTHRTETVGFPGPPLNAGMRIRIRALSATTDAEITGVTWAQFLVYGRDESDELEGPEPELPVLVIPIAGAE